MTIYDPQRTKTSRFTEYESIELDDYIAGLKNGGNAKWEFQVLLDKFASVYGASLRTYEFKSEMVADDIQPGEYALVEETYWSLYKITSDAATAPNIALDSGYTATRESILNPNCTDYADAQTKMAAGVYAAGDQLSVVTPSGPGFTVVQDDGVTHYDHDGGVVITQTGSTTVAGEYAIVRNYSGPVYLEWFGGAGDYNPAGAAGNGTNNYDAFWSAISVNPKIELKQGHYRYTDSGSIQTLTSDLNLSGAAKASTVYSNTETQIHVTEPRAPFYMGNNTVTFNNFAWVCNKDGPLADQYEEDADNMTGPYFKMDGVHIRGNISSTQGSDANIGTDNLVESDGITFTSAKTITDFSPYETFKDVAGKHGIGLLLSKSLDSSIRDSVISGFGVGLANFYNDLLNVDGLRLTSNGINIYDHRSVATAWGRLAKYKNIETLNNLRCPNILLEDSSYIDIDHCYYEPDTYSATAVFIASKSSNFKLTDSEHDDLTDHAVPFMLIDNYSEGNIVRDNYFAQYTASPKSAPPIRFINTSTGNLHKREGFVIGPNKTSIFPRADFSDATNASYIFNFREGELRQNFLCPTNVWAGVGAEHAGSVQNGRLSFSDGVSAGKFFSCNMPLPKYSGTLTISIRADSVSGSQIFFSITLRDNCGRTVRTIQNGNLSGFTDGTYVTRNVTYSLDSNDISGCTDVWFSFPTDGGYVASISLS